MNVKQLITLLGQCDPEARVVTCDSGAYSEVTMLRRHAALGCVGRRASYQRISAVELVEGSVQHRLDLGQDILEEPEILP